MKKIAAFLVLLATAAPAQDATDDGFNLMEEGARMFFDGIMRQMEPTMKDLRGMAEDIGPRFRALATEMGPALIDLIDKVDDFRNYDAPVFLDNGDILIRRKPEAPVYVPPEPGTEIDI